MMKEYAKILVKFRPGYSLNLATKFYLVLKILRLSFYALHRKVPKLMVIDVYYACVNLFVVYER